MAHAGKLTTFKTATALDLRAADSALMDHWTQTAAALARSGIAAKSTSAGFGFGATVETPDGPVPVEQLMVGDLVLTADNGPRPISNIGLCEIPGTDLIRIEAGALGSNGALTLVAEHFVTIASGIAELLFGEYEVFARIDDLADHYDIRRLGDTGTHAIVALYLDQQEVLTVNGISCASGELGQAEIAARPILAPHEVLVLRAPMETNGLAGTAIAIRAA